MVLQAVENENENENGGANELWVENENSGELWVMISTML